MSIVNTLKHGAKVVSTFAKANSPVICTGIALVGLAATVVSVVKATKKTSELVKKAEEEKGEKLTKKEFVKVAWKPCVAAIISVIVTGAAIVSAQYAASAKLKSAAAAYSALLASKDALIENVENEAGKELLDTIKKKTSEDKVAEIVKTQSDQKGGLIIFDDSDDATVWVDCFSGQMFKATDDRVNRAIRGLQKRYANQDMARVEDFYKIIGWPSVRVPAIAHDMGWYSDYERHNKGWTPEIDVDAFKDVDGTIYSYIDIHPDKWLDDESIFPF